MIKFDLTKGLIILPVTFAYSKNITVKADALVDTGSAGTALDINLLTLDPTRRSDIVEISGIGGGQDVVIQEVDGIQFGDKSVSDFEVEFGDIASRFGFTAIIGSNLLDALGACVDYDKREIRLSSLTQATSAKACQSLPSIAFNFF